MNLRVTNCEVSDMETNILVQQLTKISDKFTLSSDSFDITVTKKEDENGKKDSGGLSSNPNTSTYDLSIKAGKDTNLECRNLGIEDLCRKIAVMLDFSKVDAASEYSSGKNNFTLA